MTAMAHVLRSRGVEILEETSVSRITLDGGRARAVDTTSGTLEADAVVLAAGARSSAFAAQLGCRIPIQPGKGYSITWNTRPGELPRLRIAPRTPIIFEEFHVAVTPWASGIRVGSTMEFAGYDSTINERRIALFKRVAEENLVEPPRGPIEEEWCGWRPMTFDDLPCIGPAPKVPNVIIAAGHGMIGMATAPASGKLAAELVTGEKPHIDPTPYSLRRFDC
jgi:D-amino-acid dehydrogenase